MFVTHSFRIPYDPNVYDELRIMQWGAVSVWNDIVREATSYYFTRKKWLRNRDSIHSKTNLRSSFSNGSSDCR